MRNVYLSLLVGLVFGLLAFIVWLRDRPLNWRSPSFLLGCGLITVAIFGPIALQFFSDASLHRDLEAAQSQVSSADQRAASAERQAANAERRAASAERKAVLSEQQASEAHRQAEDAASAARPFRFAQVTLDNLAATLRGEAHGTARIASAEKLQEACRQVGDVFRRAMWKTSVIPVGFFLSGDDQKDGLVITYRHDREQLARGVADVLERAGFTAALQEAPNARDPDIQVTLLFLRP